MYNLSQTLLSRSLVIIVFTNDISYTNHHISMAVSICSTYQYNVFVS